MSFAIRLEKVSKFYRPRSAAARRAWARKGSDSDRYSHDSGFAALRDVSLAVDPGEAVAVIGRNGAGKTTLMRVLAGVVQPTSGRVEIAGRASSLLGLRAGMNPRLSGRENIRLYGALMGFSQGTVDERMPEIIAFSGLRAFVDQPVASYSPGMASRLAFSTAVTLEPQILLVDEVLAVGDATFQKRALERMQRYFEGGATVVLSSHNSVAVESLCSRAVWLDQGQVRQIGSTREVIAAYQSFCASRGSGRRAPQSMEIVLRTAAGEHQRHFPRGETIGLTWCYDDLDPLPTSKLEVWLIDLVTKKRIERSAATDLPARGELRCALATAGLRTRPYIVEIRWNAGGPSDEAEVLDRAPLTIFNPDERPAAAEGALSAVGIEPMPDDPPGAL